MGVNIDGPDVSATDFDGQAWDFRLGTGCVQHAAATETDPGRSRALQKTPAGGHLFSPSRPVDRSASSVFQFLFGQIAKAQATEQSYLVGIAAGCREM
jgi:hypothetical protein